MTIKLCNGPHYFEMGLYNDFDIKQYGNIKKTQIKISYSLNLKKKGPKKPKKKPKSEKAHENRYNRPV
jgi:hypothetical protein